MHTRDRWSLTLLLAAVLWLAGGAAQAAGRVTLAYGDTSIDRAGTRLQAARGQVVEEGDLLRTGGSSFLHVRMDDGAVIALKPGSEFQIEAYRLPAAPPPLADPLITSSPTGVRAAAAATGGSGARVLLRLVKGGFRTVTGYIGKTDRSEYQVITPVATIGVRGTDYSALLCNADCRDAPNGLHAKVSQGAISIRNLIGDEQIVLDEEYVYVATGDSEPELGLIPPDELRFELPPPEQGEEGDTGDAPPPPGDDSEGPQDDEGIGAAPVEPPGRLRPGAGSPQSYAFGFAPQGGPLAEARLGRASEIQTDAQGNLVAFVGEDGAYALGGARVRDSGFDPGTALRWGRWSEGNALVNGQALSLQQQSLHWILGPELDAAPGIARSGSASYTLVGNTSPTDNHGNVGFLGSASFGADFTNQTVHSSLELGMGNDVWTASGSGQLLPQNGLFGGAYSEVSVNGQTDGSGIFTGFFVPAGDGGIPVGAGLNYSLSAGQTTVSGVAVFGNPSSSPAP